MIYKDLAPGETRELSLAKFLKSCTRLDKRLLGDFISKPDNIELLKAFIGLFDFKGVSAQLLPGRFMNLNRYGFLERRCRGNARALGILPTTWRIATDCSYHGDLCVDLLRVWPRCVCFLMSTVNMRLRHAIDEIKSEDAVYVLAYSVIMLNTDQHNPQIRVSLPIGMI